MSRLINLENCSEGIFFLKWMRNRLLVNNKNVLGAEVGPTGSGKSYRDLRKVELWYKDYLKKPFPLSNICFGVTAAMERLTSGELSRGEILIFEEAGANLGSLDFQNKVSKMFNYVLQSFRSMNVGIFFNLPYLSMLNKTARMLLHYSSESLGIDFKNQVNTSKMFFHQVNQRSGQIYVKYPRIRINGVMKTLKFISWGMPDKHLAEAYESKKQRYLMDTTASYLTEVKKLERENNAKMARRPLSKKQEKILELWLEGKTQPEIAKIMCLAQPTVWQHLQNMKKWGYSTEK